MPDMYDPLGLARNLSRFDPSDLASYLSKLFNYDAITNWAGSFSPTLNFVQSIETARDGEECSSMYAPSLRLKGAAPTTERLAQFMDNEKAAQFVQWFRAKLPQRPISLAGDKSR